jgi:hypothetical protein
VNKKLAQKGAIAPLLILGLLIAGIFITTKLVNIPQIFKSKASLEKPAAPTNLIQIDCINDNKVARVVWDKVQNVNVYKVRMDDLSNPWDGSICPQYGNIGQEVNGDYCSNFYSISDNPLERPYKQVFTVKPNQNYDFWVHATNEAGDSNPTHLTVACPKPATAPTPTPTPASDPAFGAPQNLTVDCTKGPKPFSWDRVNGATGYKVRIDNMENGDIKENQCAQDGAPGEQNQTNGDYCNNSVSQSDSSRISINFGQIGPTVLHHFWVSAKGSTGDSAASNLWFICPHNGVSTQVFPGISIPVANPAGNPTLTTQSIFYNPFSDYVEIRGANFGTQTGTVVYSRGGEHKVIINSGLLWSNNLVRLPRTIKDPDSPVKDKIAAGQYIQVCKVNPNSCSPYVVLPNF